MTHKCKGEVSKREMILLAAVQVFSERGFHEARVEEIARKAGVGKGTVYQYFTTKKHLFYEVLKEGMEYYRLEIQREQESGESLPVRLGRIVSLQLTFADRHRNMTKVMMNNPESISEKAKEIYLAVRDGIHKELVRLFEGAVERGEIPSGDFDTAAWVMLGALNAISTTYLLNGEEFNPVELEQKACSFVQMFLYGLKHVQ